MAANIVALRSPRNDHIHEVTDRPMRLQGMTQTSFSMDYIVILATNPLTLEIACTFKLRDDPLHRTLSDSHSQSDFTKRLSRITRQAN